MKTKAIVVGAGGHGKVVAEAAAGAAKVLGFVDPDKSLQGKTVGGLPVLGGDEALKDHAPKAVALCNGVGAAGSTAARRAVYERLRREGYGLPAVIAASAHVSPSASVADGAQILTRAIVHPGASVGENSVVNTAAVVEHDCEVGAHAFIGPGAILCGGVVLEEDVFIGAGAILLPGVRVGAGAQVAAGALVHKDLPARGRALTVSTRYFRGNTR